MSEATANQTGRDLNMGRDSSWLIGADIFAVFLALIGQVVLTRALITEDYGIFIIALDVFATTFLIIDLGLPTILTRDGANCVNKIWEAIWRIYRIQFVCMIPFVVISLICVTIIVDDWAAFLPVIVTCMLVALAHIFSYAPRSGLRAAGYAWMEACTKVIERIGAVAGYLTLYYFGSDSVESYAIAFLIGALLGLISAVLFARFTLKPTANDSSWQDLDECWIDNKSLILQSLPFAITLGILPYVIRIEKFIVAGTMGVDSAALFHVAQIAWLAGLVVPQALRAALLPILGQRRNDEKKFFASIEKSLDLCFGILPIGLFGGALLIQFLLPIAFPEQYIDGSIGPSAVELFMILLIGWCLTLLATPSYTALQAGENPWKFTLFIGFVVVFGCIIGFILIGSMATSPTWGLYAAAIASTLTSAFLLFSSLHLAKLWLIVRQRKTDFFAAVTLVSITCFGFATNSLLALSGLVLFMFIPRGWKAMLATDY
ncbi:MAG: oligosaccharide flippase family protein [Candidatus Poseidoniaceae archaeon]